MKKIIFYLIKVFFYMCSLTMFLLFSCSEPGEKTWSKSTYVDKDPSITLEDITIGDQQGEFEYKITNTGNDLLKLINYPNIVICGKNESDFLVIEQPSKLEIEGGQSTTFKIKFHPKSPGTKEAIIAIPNNTKVNPYTYPISNISQQYKLTINSTNRGDVSSSITFYNKLNTTIYADPDINFYFYKWRVISGNVTIDTPNLRSTAISVYGNNAVIEPMIFTFDPKKAPNINLETIQCKDFHDYAFIPLSKTWEEADIFCSDNNGYLATITSSEENNFVHYIRGDSGIIWLGARRNEDGIFQWITSEPFNYENWDNNQPDNYHGNEYYLEMKSDGEWNDIESKKHYFVCEWGN